MSGTGEPIRCSRWSAIDQYAATVACNASTSANPTARPALLTAQVCEAGPASSRARGPGRHVTASRSPQCSRASTPP